MNSNLGKNSNKDKRKQCVCACVCLKREWKQLDQNINNEWQNDLWLNFNINVFF